MDRTTGFTVSRVKVKAAEAGPVLPATSVCLTFTEFSPSAAVKLEAQVVPPSAENSTAAPDSTPLSASAPSLVTLSVEDAPVSLARATPGADGLVVSRVKVKAAEAGPVLPATSVCRTFTEFSPSAAVKLEAQVVPPSVEYSTTAPDSTPLSASAPSLVTLSVAETPVSLARATPGADGLVVSRVKVKAAEAGPVLPATSVCRTFTELRPSTAVKLEAQVVPPSAENSTAAPDSTPLSASAPSLGTLSEAEVPVSLARATPGAD